MCKALATSFSLLGGFHKNCQATESLTNFKNFLPKKAHAQAWALYFLAYFNASHKTSIEPACAVFDLVYKTIYSEIACVFYLLKAFFNKSCRRLFCFLGMSLLCK